MPGREITINNPGTWNVRPDAYVTGTLSNSRLGNLPVPKQGQVENYRAWFPELTPGVNTILTSGITGTVKLEFTPRYIWGVA
jgi:hypothetical protein